MAVLYRLKSYGLILVVIATYALLLLILAARGVLSESDLINNVTIFVGWIVALLTAAIYLSKTRKDSQKLKKEEVRRSLEIDAFREINKAINNFANVLSKASREYKWRPFLWSRAFARDKEQGHKQGFRFYNMKAAMEVDEERQGLVRRLDELKLTIEAHEIAVIQFDDEIKRIESENDCLDKTIVELRGFIMMKKKDDLFSGEGLTDLDKKCRQIEEESNKIGKHLGDYRIELMNEFMGPIFEHRIPTERTKNSSPEGTANQ